MPNIIEITDFSDPRLDLYARLSEKELAHSCEPAPGLFLAESPRVIERALDAGYEPISLLVERRQLEGQARDIIDRCEDIPVFTADFAILSKLPGYPLTRKLHRPFQPWSSIRKKGANSFAKIKMTFLSLAAWHKAILRAASMTQP